MGDYPPTPEEVIESVEKSQTYKDPRELRKLLDREWGPSWMRGNWREWTPAEADRFSVAINALLDAVEAQNRTAHERHITARGILGLTHDGNLHLLGVKP